MSDVTPGDVWREIVRRPTLDTFAQAFTADPILEAAVVEGLLKGVGPLFEFFRVTRSMYERIGFIHETRSTTRVCLEWEGLFQGREISGATVLSYERGVIARIRLYHYPHAQLNAFAVELKCRCGAPISTALSE
jgi:hypothetical protein